MKPSKTHSNKIKRKQALSDDESRKQERFLEVAERFRVAKTSLERKRLGNKLGRIVFGD